MRALSARIFAVLLVAALAGCGFHLRGAGSAQLPYKTMYIALPETAEVSIWLQRHIRASGSTQVVDEAEGAEAVFQQLNETRYKTILSVNREGRAREFRLLLNYTFRVVNRQGKELVPPNEVTLYRDISYDDSSVLAKTTEEAAIWREMTNDLVTQIMRRLAMLKPRNPDAETE